MPPVANLRQKQPFWDPGSAMTAIGERSRPSLVAIIGLKTSLLVLHTSTPVLKHTFEADNFLRRSR